MPETTPPPHPEDLDIGPSLKTPFCYSSQEFQDLIDSQHYSDSVGPLPASLTQELELACLEAETKTWASLLGSMQLINPTPHIMRKCELPVIPTVYLLGIKNMAMPPLHFFTKEHIRIVNYSP